MDENVEAKLTRWSAKATDDIDLRTEEGVQQYAEQYAARKGVPFAEALTEVRALVERRRAVSRGVVATS